MHRAITTALLLLSTVAFISTSILYTYPLFFGCAFPSPSASHPAPFRLLVLGDPQLEGDSSLPTTSHGEPPSLRSILRLPEVSEGSLYERMLAAQGQLKNDIPLLFQLLRKRLDLFGNDYYLAHIYRTVSSLLEPTHVTVLGDLLGSQWISDEEFERRGERYWGRVFSGARRVDDEIAEGVWMSALGEDQRWKRRIINVVGNHDIGYGGDVDEHNMHRFERVFGKANFETRFSLPSADDKEAPEIRIVNLNSLNLDVPVLHPDLQAETYDFINEIITTSRPVEDTTVATILLTHLPLHKEAGVCVDGPMIKYYENERNGGVKEQNHLSYDLTKTILESIYGKSGDTGALAGGMGRDGIILTGHDHEGCDVWHHLPYSEDGYERRWAAQRWNETTVESRKATTPGIREVTVRSMMGDFEGNAGLLSAWFDEGERSWRFEYSSCKLGKQHWWWVVHVIDLVTIGSWTLIGITWGWKRRRRQSGVVGKAKIH